MDFRTPRDKAFDAGHVSKVAVRFEIGKNSDEILPGGFPVHGGLLFTDVVMAPVGPLPRITTGPGTASDNKFLVGLNYPFINYGWDIGVVPYGGRAHGGFSSFRHKLDHDFATFASMEIDVVRVFLLGDLRTGVRRDQSGRPIGLDSRVLEDLDALVGAAEKHGLSLIPVLVDFLAADGADERDLGNPHWRWKEGEAVDLLTEPQLTRVLVEDVLRPVVRRLATAAQRRPGLIYATEIVNEPENAVAVATAELWPRFVSFIRDTVSMIRRESDLRITLGSRDRDDLVRFWSDLPIDIWQFHFYDKAGEEEARTLDEPADRMNLSGPVIVGELEPSGIANKLDLLRERGYAGALFWSFRGLDGYRVDLDEIRAWKHRSMDSKEGK